MVHNLTGGGAERVAVLWANGFIKRGDIVTVVIQDSASKKYELSDKINVVENIIPFRNRYVCKLLSILGVSRKHYIFNLKRIIYKNKPDVIIGVMGDYAREAYQLTKGVGAFVIQTYHGCFDLPIDAPENRKRDIRDCIDKDSCLIARTVLTKADKQFIGNKMNNVFVMPNPLPFEPMKIVPNKENVILACGRLDVWDVKGFDILIKSWGKIAMYFPDWKLQIAGTGSHKANDYLLRLTKESKIENQVELLGFRDDIVNLYRKAEIFVLSSRYEGFGMVLIEAMSQGCACIACDYKGRQKEIIEDDSQGIVCVPDDINSLSVSIQKMIQDVSYRKECQKNAIKRSEYFSLDKTMQRWDTIFKELGLDLDR